MDDRVEVEVNGRRFRVPRHMLEDMQRFGATTAKRVIKNPPEELLNMKPKAEVKKTVIKPDDVLPEMKTEPVAEKKPARKSPVRSKSTK